MGSQPAQSTKARWKLAQTLVYDCTIFSSAIRLRITPRKRTNALEANAQLVLETKVI